MLNKKGILSYWNQRFRENGVLSAGYTDKLIQKIDDLTYKIKFLNLK